MATSCGADLRLNICEPSGRSMPPVAEDGPPPAAAEQVDVRAHVRERITRCIDAIHPGNRVEDNAPPLRHLVIHAGCQGDGAEWDLRATVWPRPLAVGAAIAGLRQWPEHAEPDRLLGQPWADLVKEEVRGLRRRLCVREVRGSCIGSDVKPPVTTHAVGVGKRE